MIWFSIEPPGVLVGPWHARMVKVVSAGTRDALVLALAQAADASLRNILTERNYERSINDAFGIATAM
jgi:hypothetical protein